MLSCAYRPVTAQVLGTVLAFSAAVALLHRFFPEECVFSFEGAVLILVCNNLVVTRLILGEEWMFAVAAARLLW